MADAIGKGGAGSQPGTGGSGGAGETPADAQSNVADATTSNTADAPTDDASTFPYSCDDLGPEPMIAPACATITATRTITDGKPTDESTLDTALIQNAISACPAGQSVQLTVDGDKVAFLSGPLAMKAGVTLWIDTGVTLFATRNPRDFDYPPGTGRCGTDNSNSTCSALINVISLADVTIAGGGTIDGRGGEPVIGDAASSSWWDIEDQLAGQMAGPRLVQVTQSTNFTLYQVTLRNSPKFHVVIDRTKGYRVWGITVNTDPSSPNTDAVDPSGSTNGIIAYNKLSTGDDNIAIKGGNALVDHLVIAHNHFGRGHGMSIGSETNAGVRNVAVCDLTLDGAQNGLRIKSDSSRGGLVQSISYTDVCMRNVSNPLVFDPYYDRTATGPAIPDYRNIVVRNTHVLGGGIITVRGYDAMHPLSLTLDNVFFDSAPRFRNPSPLNAGVTFGPGPVNVAPLFDPAVADAGTMLTVNQLDSNGAAPRACGDDVWVTF
jgi:polygalacturonase